MGTHENRKHALRTGLCAGCAKQIGCDYLHTPQHVFQCLEFEELSVEGSSIGVEKKRREPLGAVVRPAGVRSEPGLCPICADRSLCTYPRLPGGIWFCEEYR